MPFDWMEFVALAKKLKDENNEASHRSAISRVYYGVFCTARNYLETLQTSSRYREGTVHSTVWLAFRNKGGHTHRAIGIEGDRLCKMRTAADYDDNVKNLNLKSSEAFLIADKILQCLR